MLFSRNNFSFCVFLFLSSLFGNAQTSKLPDSIETKIRNAGSEIKKIIAYRDAAVFLTAGDDLRSILSYADSGLAIANKRLPFIKDENDRKTVLLGIATLQGVRGTVFNTIEKLGPATVAYLEAIKIQEKFGAKRALVANLNNLGIVYYSNKEYEKSLECYRKAISENKNGEFKQWLAATYHGISTVFMDQQKYTEAEDYINRAVSINTEMKNDDWLANNYTVLEELRRIQKRKDERFFYLKEIERISETKGDIITRELALLGLAKFYSEERRNVEAVKNLEKGLKISVDNELYELQSDFAWELMEFYENNGNKAKAYDYAKIFIRAGDTLLAYRNKEEVYRSEINFEYENKRAKDSLRMDEERLMNEMVLKNKNQEIEHEKNIKIVIYISLSLVLVLFGFTFRSYLQKKRANQQNIYQKIIILEKAEQLEARQKEILDSIYYARRIQDALMASERQIDKQWRELKSKSKKT